MDATGSSQPKDRTSVERKSGRELVATRTFDAPQRLVFDAWTQAAQFRQWWVPASCGLTLLTCDIDARTGGTYRLVFSHPAAPEPMAVHGRYVDVVPPSRLVWTNEEAGDAGQVTTVTFEDRDGRTLLVMSDLYPTEDALDEAIASGSTSGIDETLDQLEALLAAA